MRIESRTLRIKASGILCSKKNCKNKAVSGFDLCDKHMYFEIELNKIKDFLYSKSEFEIGIIEHLKIEEY
jgi:hypothetical protein